MSNTDLELIDTPVVRGSGRTTGGIEMRAKRTYSRMVWVLTPSFKPVEVEVVAPYDNWDGIDYGDQTKDGKVHAVNFMFDSKDQAIAAGYARLSEQKTKLDKIVEGIAKQKAELDKASAK